MRQALVEPLDDVLGVLQRLRDGDLTARAEEKGPEEIRVIAAALNMLAEENVRGRDVEVDVFNRIEEIDRVRTELVSTVSHELRTPLTSIKGYLELLQDQLSGQLTDSQVSMLAIVRRNLERLTELITNLLALSRAEETQLTVEPIDLRGVAAEVAGDIRLTAASRDITVKTIQSAAPVVMLGDRSQLVRAVLNLLSNAVKFSKPGDVVEVRVLQQGGEAVIEVVDEGIGIPASDLPGLGSRFYRASNAMKAEIAGTGLGLRIVQTIVDRHEGSLSVESVEGEGTTAPIRLPMARAVPGTGQTPVRPVGDRALARD
jgi:signal transduction histidine kinase